MSLPFVTQLMSSKAENNVSQYHISECEDTEGYMTPWATILAMTALYVVLFYGFWRYGKKTCLPSPDAIFPYKKRLNYLRSVLNDFLIDDMFIELTDIKLGQGAVGFIFKGYVFPKTHTRFKQRKFAAVKMSFPMPQKCIGLLEEAARLAKLNHPNIVKLLAVSKLSFSAFRPVFAMEWLEGGSLSEFFREEIRRKDEVERKKVYVRQIINILKQVAEALKYLHENRNQDGSEFTHGDVAARNILLTSRDLNSCAAKLGDFGLPIDFGPRLPIPWLPPEIVCSLDRNTKHRPESDVWMFGVLMWECATLGAEPHFQKSYEEITQDFLLPDRGLSCPVGCPQEYWFLITDCVAEQHRRPRFSGPEDDPVSVLFCLSQLSYLYSRSHQQFFVVQNVSNCTCAQHRCNAPLPVFSQR